MTERDPRDMVVVVPCFDEAARLDCARFAAFARAERSMHFLFVDDGSRDRTREVLDALAQTSPRIEVLALARNAGKAEAIRHGMLRAFELEPAFVAYFDADLATPLDELAPMRRLLLEKPELEVVLGSRVALLGRDIKRSHRRHYLGRAFATAASVVLDLVVYDTQCGAKMFRNSEAIRHVFAQPFETRWVFDVEVLARLKALSRRGAFPDVTRSVVEHPLRAWCDVSGSKLGVRAAIGSGLELARIWHRYGRH
jgi:dolichyl-phosphate beta-glucosyltransferase